jgi:hypothetical protein
MSAARSFRNMAYPSLRAEAKQSRNLTAEALWIAFAYAQGRFGGLQARHSSRSERRGVVAALLAMTGDTHPHSRGMICPSFALAVTLDKRAQGMPGARRTHSLACESKKTHELVTTGSPKHHGIPCATV